MYRLFVVCFFFTLKNLVNHQTVKKGNKEKFYTAAELHTTICNALTRPIHTEPYAVNCMRIAHGYVWYTFVC